MSLLNPCVEALTPTVAVFEDGRVSMRSGHVLPFAVQFLLRVILVGWVDTLAQALNSGRKLPRTAS